MCAFVVLFDIFVRGYRQKMTIMEAVWPITGLYLGPVMLWFYFRRGRRKSPKLDDPALRLLRRQRAHGHGRRRVHAGQGLRRVLPVPHDRADARPGGGGGIREAIKADTLSIVAFQLGMFAVMALYHLVLWRPPLSMPTPEYWLMMQLAMVTGYLTSWPVNVWLIRRGIKEKM